MAEGTMLPAGRELDALVAERVMGLAIVRPPFVPQSTSSDAIFTDEAADLWRQVYPRGAAVDRVPRYSTDVHVAFEVVTRVRHVLPGAWWAFEEAGAGWTASVRMATPGRGGWRDVADANAEALALAICYAALATLPPAGAR